MESFRPTPPPVRKVRVTAGWVRRGRRVLLARRDPATPLRGSWDVPAVEVEGDREGGDVLGRLLARRHGIELLVGARVAMLPHGIMNRRLQVEVLAARIARGSVACRDELCWVDPTDLDRVAVSGATRKIVRALTNEAR